MAAFSSSYQYHPFLFDSALILSNNNINTTTSPVSPLPLSHLYLHHHPEPYFTNNNNNNVTNNNTNNNYYNNNEQDQTVAVSCVDQSSKASMISSDNEPSVTKNLSPQSSMVVDKLETGDEQVTQKLMTPMDIRKRRIRHGSSFNNPQSKDGTEEKSKKMRKSNNNKNNGGEVKKEEEKGKKAEKKKKGSDEEPPTGYIHVRARRGQATDSHSLAERVRREKISERMKMLQRLVPGCDKVSGKALMLDEIINYVQSLQNQVEFLSMKLASVNPMFYDLASDIDTLLVRPEKLNNNSITSPAISVAPHCSTTFADTTTTTTTMTTTIFPQTNDYVLDNSASIFLQQGQRSNNVFSEDSGSHFWEAEEQRQKFLHPYGFINNNLCSFH